MDIWEEMEEDLRKKYKQAEKGYQKPPPIMKVFAIDEVNIFEVGFIFMKYAIKHFIKQIKVD